MKYLIQTGTGRIFPFTDVLSVRPDMREYTPPTAATQPEPVVAEPIPPVAVDPQPTTLTPVPEQPAELGPVVTPTTAAAPETTGVPMTERERIEAMTKDDLVSYAKEQGIEFDFRKNERAIMFHILKVKGIEA